MAARRRWPDAASSRPRAGAGHAMPPGTLLATYRCRLWRDGRPAPRWSRWAATGAANCSPHSDVDVLVLLPPTAAERTRRGGDRALHHRLLGHRAEIGSSVRTVDECLAEARATSPCRPRCWKARWSARRLFTWSPHAATRGDGRTAFLRAKTLEMRQRHTKFEDTPYALEPNCKESPGGLRDLQVVIWVARAAGLGKQLERAGRQGLITPFEVKQLRRNEGLLKLIRARLHLVAGRREDRLSSTCRPRWPRASATRSTPGQRASSEVLMRPLLLGGQGGDAAQPDPDAQHRGAHPGTEDAPMRPHRTSASSTAAACSRWPRRSLPAPTRTPSWRPSSPPATVGIRACRRARCARCTTPAT